MRIALFSGNYNYLREGANQALNQLARYLGAHGHEVRAYSPVTDTPAFEPEGDLVPVPSIALPVRGEFRLALGLPRPIRDDIRRFSPDLFHVSTPDILGTRAQTFAKRLGLPVVASQHTRFETYFGYYGLGWAVPLAEAHLRRFYRRSDHVLAPTAAGVSEMKRIRGDDRVSVWSRGIDRELFAPERRSEEWRRSHGWTDEDVVILFFGRLVLEKGIRDFVSVVHRLRARGVKVHPLIVGAGRARDELSALDDVIFTGHVDGPELAKAIASADILLHPSTTEAFGNVMLEAMASGLTVVGADAASARAMVDDGQTGFLCPSDDLERFAATVAEQARNADRRRAIGAAARRASSAYSWAAASESVLRAYQAVVDTANARPSGR